MFTNKMKCSIIWGQKGKDRVTLIKSQDAFGAQYLRYKRIGISD